MEECVYKEIENPFGANHNKQSRVYFWRQVLVRSGVWMCFFVYGLAAGSYTVVVPQIRREANSTDAVSDSMASWIAAGCNYGAFVAVIFLSIFSSFVGRKTIYMYTSIITIAAFVVFYLSKTNAQILISLIMLGVNGACILTIDLMILVECSSSNYRGVFLTIKTAMMFWGIWAANAIGTFLHWKYIAIVGISCAIYTFITSMFFPESPYWLAEKGKFAECLKAHRWLKGNNKESQKELDELMNSNKQNDNDTKREKDYKSVIYSMIKEITQKEFYKPTLLCILIICMYHATGKLVLSVYAIEIIKKITEDERTAYNTMLLLDGITVASMYAGCVLSKYVKRRTLFMCCSSIGILVLFVISGYLYLIYISVFTENKFITISLLTSFSIAVSMGPIVLSSSLLGELAPLRLRSLSFFSVTFFNFAVMGNLVKISPSMFVAFHTHGAFLFYAICSSVCLLLVYKYVPETKDRTLHEIQNCIMGNSKIKG